MTNQDLAAYAALLLRVSLAVMFYAHAWLKIKVFTPAGTAKYFESLGVPGFLAYLTIAAEIGGGTLLLLGIETRWIALLLVPLIAGTIVLVHGKNGWLFSHKDGGWEYPAFWIVGLVVLSLLGDGSLALGPVLRLPWRSHHGQTRPAVRRLSPGVRPSPSSGPGCSRPRTSAASSTCRPTPCARWCPPA